MLVLCCFCFPRNGYYLGEQRQIEEDDGVEVLKIESLCIVLYVKYSTRESLYIGKGVSNA
jgi:hypothetical protein